MQYLTIIKAVLSLFPLALQLVQTVEAALPQSGAGAQKLEVVKTTLSAAYATAEGVEATFEQIWPALAAGLSSMVAAFNAVGIFKKSAAPSST